AGQLEAEGRRLGVDRVGPAHHQAVLVLPRLRRGDPGQPVRIAQEELPGGPELEREGRVDDIGAGEAEVQVAALGTDRLGDLGHEGDDVVVNRLLDLGDPVDVDAGAGL